MESSDLIEVAGRLEHLHESFEVEHAPLLRDIGEAARNIARAWSGSNLGYHARVYYEGFAMPPSGAHFSSEWGLQDIPVSQATRGDWREYQTDQVQRMVYARAGSPDLKPARVASDKLAAEVNKARSEVLSILGIALGSGQSDPYLQGLRDKAEKAVLRSVAEFGQFLLPHGQLSTRDMIAAHQSLQFAPHQTVMAEAVALNQPSLCAKELADISRQAGSHLARLARRARKDRLVGTNVFIGHGRSSAWRDLKDFIKDRLGLPYDEFNRVPVAGVTNTTRLSEMLDAAAVAFIIMTAEDEQADGALRARENVVHEVGLFQGRLGFTKAIVLLEKGCGEFSNIQGLGQIHFPKGNIAAVFEEIRRVLEREKLLSE